MQIFLIVLMLVSIALVVVASVQLTLSVRAYREFLKWSEGRE